MAEVATSPQQRGTAVRHVDMEQPWKWLTLGWKDLVACRSVSVLYGVVFAVAGALVTYVLWVNGLHYLVLPMAAGFLLIGPLAAVGLYELSRRRETGEQLSFGAAFFAYRRNASQIALMGMALLLMLIFWARIAALIFMLYFGIGNVPSVDKLLVETFLNVSALPFLVFGTLIGGVFAAATFAMSAISIPMLLDKPEANVMDAMSTSFRAVTTSPKAMMLWGLMIVLFIGAGILTLYIGLIIALPLIGHATWHAYKDMVPGSDQV